MLTILVAKNSRKRNHTKYSEVIYSANLQRPAGLETRQIFRQAQEYTFVKPVTGCAGNESVVPMRRRRKPE